MAKLACAHGAIVTIVGRRQPRLDQVCAEAMAKGATGKCFSIKGDMAIKEDVIHVVKTASETMGGIDALILNHVWAVMKFFEDIPFEGLEEAIDITYKPNVFGNMWLIHLSLPHLKQTTQSASHILFVSSLSISHGVPKAVFYASSKLAMQGAMDVIRMELGPKSKVHLTTVNVGAVATETLRDALTHPEDEDAAMDADKCAGILLESMLAKKRLVTMPLVDKPFPIPGQLAMWFPEFAEWLVRKQYSITDERQGFLKDKHSRLPNGL